MFPARKGPAGKRDLLWFGVAMFMPLPWIATRALGGLGMEPGATAFFAGLAILGSAFLLTWSMELAERDIPQTLALLVLALVSVLPEYAVDLHFAVTAATKPEYAQYAVANMTGANRLLIGLGWVAVVLVACQKSGRPALEIDPHHRVEIRFLALATFYAFLVPLDGRISLLDAAVLLGLFLAYVRAAMKGEPVEVELVGPGAVLDRAFGDVGRRSWAIAMFLFAGYAIFVSAEPFADGLVTVGQTTGIDEFILVQWVAPLASESPEFVIAILFALRGRGSVGIGALISSKVNQWTLLVGALPIAYCIAAGSLSGLPLDERQTEELWLTSAQSLLAVLLIAELSFTRVEAILLAALFLTQLVFPTSEVRSVFTVLYLVVAGILFLFSAERRQAFLSLFQRGGL